MGENERFVSHRVYFTKMVQVLTNNKSTSGTNAGQSLILVVCTLLGYGLHALIVLREQEKRADSSLNLKEFFGYNELALIWGPTILAFSIAISMLTVYICTVSNNHLCAKFSACRCGNPNANEFCHIF